MLDNRPIAKKTLYGTGAFAFVFAAAMSGTAFMITGGVGHGADSAPPDAPAYQIAANDAWAETPPQETAAALTPVSMPARHAPVVAPQPAPEVGTVVDASSASPDDTQLSGDTGITDDASKADAPAPDEKTKSDNGLRS